MIKITRKTAIWTIPCFYPLPSLNNVGKQWEKLMGSKHFIGGDGGFLNTLSKTSIIFCRSLSEIYKKRKIGFMHTVSDNSCLL